MLRLCTGWFTSIAKCSIRFNQLAICNYHTNKIVSHNQYSYEWRNKYQHKHHHICTRRILWRILLHLTNAFATLQPIKEIRRFITLIYLELHAKNVFTISLTDTMNGWNSNMLHLSLIRRQRNSNWMNGYWRTAPNWLALMSVGGCSARNTNHISNVIWNYTFETGVLVSCSLGAI